MHGKVAQTALNERLGIERIVELHALLDACIACLGKETEEAIA